MTNHHLPFTARPLYKTVLSVPALRAQAARSRKAGHYNMCTLWWFRKAWLLSGSPQDYLQYLLFRRDLGYPLNANRADKVKALLNKSLPFKARHRLIGYRARQLRNLLDEYHGDFENPAVPQEESSRVRTWRRQQANWRTDLDTSLQRAQHIAIVGNAPVLRGGKQGSVIDRADLVVRFNQFASEHTDPADTGQRLDIWAMAPGFEGMAPACRQVLLTGPDMLWHQQRFVQLHNCKQPVISVALVHWRKLVRELAAPPSAGLLTIGRILSVAPKKRIRLYGFSFTAEPGSQYHHTDPTHKAVARHNWVAERLWLQKEFNS